MVFAKPSGAQTKTTNRSFEKLTVSGAETLKIFTFCSFLITWKFRNHNISKKQNLAERKPKRPTVIFQKEKIKND